MNKDKKKIDFLKDFKKLNPKPVKVKKPRKHDNTKKT